MALYSWLGNITTADWVFSLVTQSAVLFLIGWILARAARRIAAPLKSGILLTLIVLLVLLPAGILVFKADQGSLYKLPISPRGQAFGNGPEAREGGSSPADQAPMGTAGQNRDVLSGSTGADLGRMGPFNLRSVNPVLMLLNSFGFIWIVGFLILLGRLFFGIIFLSGFRRSLVKIPDEALSDAVEAVKAAFPLTRPPSIYISPAIDSPIALGIVRPMIVLPQLLYKNLSAEELTNILIHETAHIRHFDQVSGLLQRLFTSIYWWNPLAYVLNASLSVTREDVSDNYAIQKSGAHSYAKCLVALAQKTSLITRLPAAVGMATAHVSLEERVKHIMSKERVMATKLAKSVVFLLAFSAVLLVAIIGRYSWTLTAAGDDVKIFALPPGVEPHVLAVDRDRIYLCEYENFPQNPESHIAIYSRSDFSLLGKIGQVGKAAGEFQAFGPGGFYLINDQIWAVDPRKTIVFSRDGNFLKEIQIPREIFAPLYPILPVGDKFVSLTGDWPDISKGRRRVFGRIYDSDFHMIREFYGEIPILAPPPPPPPPPPPGQKTEGQVDKVTVAKEEYQAIPDCIDFAVAEDKIFVADTRKGFHIAVFDSQGAPLYEINRDYIALPVPPEYKAALMKKLQETQGWLNQVANIKFRDTLPAFYSFKIADHKIYVSTYAKQDGLHELVVMNLKGDVLKKSFAFPLGLSYESMYNNFYVAKDRFAILDDKIYYLAKNAKDGSHEVRIQELK